MPFRSAAQRRFMFANKAKLEAQGVDVDEWNEATKGKKLPERVAKKASALGVLYKFATDSGAVGAKPITPSAPAPTARKTAPSLNGLPVPADPIATDPNARAERIDSLTTARQRAQNPAMNMPIGHFRAETTQLQQPDRNLSPSQNTQRGADPLSPTYADGSQRPYASYMSQGQIDDRTYHGAATKTKTPAEQAFDAQTEAQFQAGKAQKAVLDRARSGNLTSGVDSYGTPLTREQKSSILAGTTSGPGTAFGFTTQKNPNFDPKNLNWSPMGQSPYLVGNVVGGNGSNVPTGRTYTPAERDAVRGTPVGYGASQGVLLGFPQRSNTPERDWQIGGEQREAQRMYQDPNYQAQLRNRIQQAQGAGLGQEDRKAIQNAATLEDIPYNGIGGASTNENVRYGFGEDGYVQRGYGQGGNVRTAADAPDLRATVPGYNAPTAPVLTDGVSPWLPVGGAVLGGLAANLLHRKRNPDEEDHLLPTLAGAAAGGLGGWAAGTGVNAIKDHIATSDYESKMGELEGAAKKYWERYGTPAGFQHVRGGWAYPGGFTPYSHVIHEARTGEQAPPIMGPDKSGRIQLDAYDSYTP